MIFLPFYNYPILDEVTPIFRQIRINLSVRNVFVWMYETKRLYLQMIKTRNITFIMTKSHKNRMSKGTFMPLRQFMHSEEQADEPCDEMRH